MSEKENTTQILHFNKTASVMMIYGQPPYEFMVSKSFIDEYRKLKNENEDLINKLADYHKIQRDFDLLFRSKKDLEFQNEILQQEIDRLKIQNLELIKLLEEQNDKINKQNDKINKQNDVIHNLNDKINNQNDVIHNLNDKINNQNDVIHDLNGNIHNLNKKMSYVVAENEDMKNQHKLSDIFRCFRDWIIPYERDQRALSFNKAFTTLQPNDIINALFLYKRDSTNIVAREMHNNAKKLMTELNFNPSDILNLRNLNRDRNTDTHFIDSDKYEDDMYMLEKLISFETIVDSLTPVNNLYANKQSIKTFIHTLKQYFTDGVSSFDVI